jgi:hypothetical protein
MSCWVYVYDITTSSFSDFLSKDNKYVLQVDGYDVFQPRFALQYAALSWSSVDGLNPLPLNSWQFICGTYDKSLGSDRQKLYLNGTFENSVNNDITILDNASSDLFVGKMGSTTSLTRFCHGIIDDCRIYNRALSAAEVSTMYACRGVDGICDGLVFRTLLNEKHNGATASGAGTMKEISNYQDHGTAAGNPVYKESILKFRRRTF